MHIYFNWTSLRCNKKKFDLARETGEEEKKLQKKMAGRFEWKNSK